MYSRKGEENTAIRKNIRHKVIYYKKKKKKTTVNYFFEVAGGGVEVAGLASAGVEEAGLVGAGLGDWDWLTGVWRRGSDLLSLFTLRSISEA